MKNYLKYVDTLRLGQESGLRYFMTQLGASLRFFAFQITKNKEVSEEIVSESYYKLWQDRHKVLSAEHIKSYLYLVTRNACYDFIGSSYHKSAVSEDDALLDIEEPNADLLTQIIYTELIEQIVEELNSLPKQQAEVFRMSYLEGMDTQEICDALGTTTSNVYYARSKALAALRIIFKEKDISLYSVIVLLSSLH